jgi:DNA-binding transcriptional ArsR family regulator
MLERYEIENIEQLRAIADLLRVRILDLLRNQPMTVTQLGEALGVAPARAYYHVRELEKVGLLRLVETREKGGILEKYYQPVAREITVEKSLLSAPPSEAIVVMENLLGQIQDGFLRAFRHTLEHKHEKPGVSIGLSRLYLTADDKEQLSKQLAELFRPYEQQRGGEGEREFLISLFAYPEADAFDVVSSIALAAPQEAQVVGTASFSRADLEKVLAEGKRLHINVVGICRFAGDVSAELAAEAIASARIVGKLIASPAVRKVVMSKQA